MRAGERKAIWPAFLERYQAILSARNVVLGYEAPDQERSLMVATGADQADIRGYHQYSCPWLDRLVAENYRKGAAAGASLPRSASSEGIVSG